MVIDQRQKLEERLIIKVKMADWNRTKRGKEEDQIYKCELSGLKIQSDRTSLLCEEFGYRPQT